MILQFFQVSEILSQHEITCRTFQMQQKQMKDSLCFVWQWWDEIYKDGGAPVSSVSDFRDLSEGVEGNTLSRDVCCAYV
jgi:hypothetical protein